MFSTLNEEALKANKVYLDNAEWYCYWHGLSGDELKTQIITIAYKPTDKVVSYPFSELSSEYKKNETKGIANRLEKDFNVAADTLIDSVLTFFNDAKIEYTGKPFIKETV